MRSVGIGDLLVQQQLLAFEPLHLFLERAPHGRHGRLDDVFDHLLNLRLRLRAGRLERLCLTYHVRLAATPQLLEHRRRGREQLRLRLCVAKQRLELALDHITADRLPVAGAAFAKAVVVGVTPPVDATADRPAGRHRMFAVVAHDKTSQRKILRQVGAIIHPQAVETVEVALKDLVRDKRLMMALAPLHTPFEAFDIAGINRATKHIADTLMRNTAILRFRIERMLFEEASDIGLAFEAA